MSILASEGFEPLFRPREACSPRAPEGPDHSILFMCSAIEVITFRTLSRITMRVSRYYAGLEVQQEEALSPEKHDPAHLSQGKAPFRTTGIIFLGGPRVSARFIVQDGVCHARARYLLE